MSKPFFTFFLVRNDIVLIRYERTANSVKLIVIDYLVVKVI